ncbi:MAG: hypothetical protein D6780_01345 [Candidatus Dadabacteria bacterium]|nr:MAG: hypothetical protein D6780_01345 [Candidatus Dadabacteria bacterium]
MQRMPIKDPVLAKDKKLRRAHKIILALYLLLLFFTLFPLVDIAFNKPALIFGIPQSLLWIFFCIAAFPLIAVVGYVTLFKKWGEKIDFEKKDKT